MTTTGTDLLDVRAAAHRNRRRRQIAYVIYLVLGILLFLLFWQLLAVVGRSGHGKTTLLRVLAGLQPPTAGAVKLGDTTVMGPGSDRAMVFQQDTVFPWLHVRDNVEFGLRANKLPEDERNEITN